MKNKKQEVKSAAAALGSRGGKAVAKRGKKYMQKIGRRGADARWGNENATGKDQ